MDCRKLSVDWKSSKVSQKFEHINEVEKRIKSIPTMMALEEKDAKRLVGKVKK
jgi:hypothetical protein